jgi:hypothetical protein
MLRIIASTLTCALLAAGLIAQVTPGGVSLVTTYTLTPNSIGGLAFDPSGSTLYVNSVGTGVVQGHVVTRDPVTNQITGFGPPTVVTAAPSCDGGLVHPSVLGTWLWTTWPGNLLDQYTGSATGSTDLTAAGVPSSTGGVTVAPPWVPNAGDVLVSSYGVGGIYRITLTPNANNTYQAVVGSATLFAATPFGSEGMAYVPNGPYTGSIINCNYSSGVKLIVIDQATGIPTGTTLDLLTISLAMGVVFDPVTNDFFISTYTSASNLHHFSGVIRGDYQRNTPAASLDVDGVQGSLSAPAVVIAPLATTVNVTWSSTNTGLGWDIGLSPLAPIPSGLVLPDDQIVNVDLGSSFLFLLGGTFTIPFSNATIPILPPLGSVTAQMVVLDTSAPLGLSLSQPTQLSTVFCSYVENIDATPIGIGNYPAGWSDGGGAGQWEPLSGATTSAGTGPSGDHTTGSGVYMYCETSSLVTNFIVNVGTFAPAPVEMADFWYHMYGATVGTLALEQQDAGGTWNPIWTLSGDQGDQWRRAQVPLVPVGTTAVLRFQYTAGASFTGDVAIDDFGICL